MTDNTTAAAVQAVKDSSLSPRVVVDKIAEQCSLAIASTRDQDDVTRPGDTPGLESFLWQFWTDFLKIAQDDAAIHDRLAQILAALKSKGTQGCDGWSIWGEPASWGELSLFGPVSREEMNGPEPEDSARAQAVLSGDPPSDDPTERGYAEARKRWLNLHAFFAKLWALDIVDEHFYALAAMRTYLEPLSLSTAKEPTATTEDHTDLPPELGLEVAATWLTIAGAKMFGCREILGPKGNSNWEANRGSPGGSGGTWDGVDGYHPDRWAHWKQLITEVSQGNWRPNVVKAAQAAVEAMDKAERQGGSS